MTKTRDLANLIADSKVGPSEIDTTGTYNMNALQVGGTTAIDSSRNANLTKVRTAGSTAAGRMLHNNGYATFDQMESTGSAFVGYGLKAGGGSANEIVSATSVGVGRAGVFIGTLAGGTNPNIQFVLAPGQTTADGSAPTGLVTPLTISTSSVSLGKDLKMGNTTVIDSSRNLLDVRKLVIEGDSTSGGLKNEFKQAGTGGGDYSIMVTNNNNGSLGGGKFAILDNAVSGNNLAQARLMIDASGSVTVPGKLVTTAPSNPELLTNGTFSNGTTGWNAHGSTLSVSNGQLSVADNGGYTKAWQAITTVANEAYELTFTGVSVTGQSLVVGLSGTPVNYNTWGDIRTFAYSSSELPVTYSYVFKATTTTTYISLGSEGSNTAVFDNVSIKKVTLDDNQVLTQADLAPQLEGLGLAIDAAGRITKQYQPAFVAYKSSTTSGTNATQTVVGWEQTRTNTGNHFSTSTNRFTAPVGGMYLFNYQILFQGVANQDDQIHSAFWVNGSQRTYHIRSPGEAAIGSVGFGGYLPAQGTMLTRLNEDDYVDVRFISHGGAIDVYSGGDWSEFSGILLS